MFIKFITLILILRYIDLLLSGFFLKMSYDICLFILQAGKSSLQEFQQWFVFITLLSEFEFIVGYLHVFWLWEFIFQSWNEFWIDFYQELSNLRYCCREIRFLVFREFFHVFCPAINFFELFAWEHQSSCSKLRWLESHQGNI